MQKKTQVKKSCNSSKYRQKMQTKFDLLSSVGLRVTSCKSQQEKIAQRENTFLGIKYVFLLSIVGICDLLDFSLLWFGACVPCWSQWLLKIYRNIFWNAIVHSRLFVATTDI